MNNLSTRTYALLSLVPKGHVTTYKALANALGTKAYQAIGQILRMNPYPYTEGPERTQVSRRIPCHRVVSSDGSIGGFIGHTKGAAIKKKIGLLAREGVRVKNNTIVDFIRIRFRW